MDLICAPIQTMASSAKGLLQTKSGRSRLLVSRYASGSMEPIPAELPIPACSNTSAPDAAQNRIMLNPALRNEYFPVVTPLKWDKWHELLRQADGLDEFG